MHISYGTSRIVIAVPSCGIAIKIARIRIIQALKDLPGYIRRYDIWKKVTLQKRTLITPLGYIVRGGMENLGERGFYKLTKNPSLVPTYFSLLGLVNIQKYGTPCKGLGFVVAETLDKISGRDDRVYDDAHHFCSSGNFTRDKLGKLCMLDYGFKKTQQIIFAYGARLHNEFVFPDETK